MAIGTYDPKQVIVSFAGIPLSGYADGTFIKAERNEDGFDVKIGASGEAVRVQNRNRSGKVTLTLMSSSQANDILSGLAAQDEQLATGVGPLMVKELTGTTLVHATNAWVKKLAGAERSKELSHTEWVFETEQLDLFVGGLTIPSP